MDCHFLLQGIFLTQELNPGLLHFRQVLYQLNYEGSPLLDIYLEKAVTEKDTSTPMFVAALFRIARTWKESRCSVTGEWIKKLYIYTMEYYSPIKRNTSESVLMWWINLESIIQNELS